MAMGKGGGLNELSDPGKVIHTAGREQLMSLLEQTVASKNEWVRRMVLDYNRVDILAEYVLGLTLAPNIHHRIIRHQFSHKKSLILVYRGAGKTTVGTITKAIHYILKSRDVKILIASKTSQNSSDFLKEIKQHFESNERLIEIFGNYVGNARWDNQAIEVSGRSRPMKEPTIMTVGVEGAVASKHYDVIIADDLVDEDNSRTLAQRQKMVDWYYKMLSPTLLPPDPKYPWRGDFHHSGTRFHYGDLYGHLMNGDSDGSGGQLKGSTLIIPALNKDGTSPWPERHPPEWFEGKRREFGIIRFNSQYQCDTEAMKGQIFRYDDCQVISDESKWPRGDGVTRFLGVDLAIGEQEQHDMFAMTVVAKVGDAYYVEDFMEGQLRFADQTQRIIDWAKKWKVARTGIEINAYQKAQYQEVQRNDPSLNLRGITTLKDKVTRAWKLAAKFENRKVFFKPGQHHLIEHLVLFPANRYDDLFDSLDHAIATAEGKVRKKRASEPGIL